MPVGDPPPLPLAVAGPLGWQCPKCGATYAPWVASCTECRPPVNNLRQRIEEAQPPAALPVVPYAPPLVYPLYPAPQWPWPQDRIVWCGELPATTNLALTPEARARMTMCSGAGQSSTFTVNVSGLISPDIAGEVRDMAQRNGPWSLNQIREELRDEGDDGTAGVPARV